MIITKITTNENHQSFDEKIKVKNKSRNQAQSLNKTLTGTFNSSGINLNFEQKTEKINSEIPKSKTVLIVPKINMSKINENKEVETKRGFSYEKYKYIFEDDMPTISSSKRKKSHYESRSKRIKKLKDKPHQSTSLFKIPNKN